MAKIVDGKKLAEENFTELREKIRRGNASLSLAVVQVGENPVSDIYVNAKKKTLERNGIPVSFYRFPEEVSAEDLKKEINRFTEKGIVIQLPLPEKFDKREILNAVPFEKDADTLTSFSCGKFYSGAFENLPPVAGAVEIILKEYGVSRKGKTVALIGSGDLVGKPLMVFFAHKGATVVLLNRYTENAAYYTKQADIVVSGAGVPELVKGSMIKEGAVVIDAGTSIASGKLKGDVDIESVEKKAGILSPVPGGVGPLTIYCLASNLFNLAK